jgi:carboxymethylenebutenolidase
MEIPEGYLVYPPEGKGKALIILSEWWGIVDHIKTVVERFASQGFVAFAPDLYQGKTTKKPDEAGRLMMALNIADTGEKLKKACQFLLKDPKVTSSKVGVVGFCMGGQLALYAASVSSDIGGCVDYYGVHSAVHPEWKNINCPVLGFFGSKDAFVTQDVVKKLDESLSKAAVKHTFYTYEADHAFFNDTRPEVYHKKAAEESWSKMLQFYESVL